MDTLNIPQTLIDKIEKDNLVIFVGAGLSVASGLPNWKELTINILDSIKDRDKKISGYISALKQDLFEPIEILSKVKHLKTYAIEHLEAQIKASNKLKPTKEHFKLGNISSKLITTNYDELLEQCYPSYEKVTYNNTYKVSKISDYKSFIFKIHGDINEPDKCILFADEYEELYNNDEKSSIFEIKKILSDKSILFIGFGFNDPYFNYVFEYINKIYSGFTPEHFIVTTDNTRKWSERITTLHLEKHDDLSLLLDKIIEKKTSSEKSSLRIIQGSESAEEILSHPDQLEYDIPPNVKFWVGRKLEIENISNENFKVIFITGIGGQGKSALASHFLRNFFDAGIYEFADWRDLKEENNRFQTKLVSIIKRLTGGSIDQKDLENDNSHELVDTLFYYLKDRKIIFVFDNIDSYIDLENFVPTGGMGYFVSQALHRDHKSRFIFTCRPFIREATVNFYQISLRGLSLPECIELFQLYKVPFKQIKLEEFAMKVHSLTNGHPLWLNLIAAQAKKGFDNVSRFVDNIRNTTNFREENFSSILSQKVLSQVWSSLNWKQQTLLRGLSETVKPETVNNLKQILQSELKEAQFDQALKTLKNLNLVETKSSSISEDQIELHPLVKEYIIGKFPRGERAKFITLLVKYYDSFIYILKPKLNSDLTLASFQNWTSKIELEINKGDFSTALVALEEVSSAILAAGFVEEYLRVAEKLFDSLDWTMAIEKEVAYFHSQLTTSTNKLTQYGAFEKVELYLDKYEKLIPGKSSYYLSSCSERCYLEWFRGNYERAIQIGEKGEFLLTNSGLTDTHSLKHNLALARRDSRIEANLEKAINFFLNGEDLTHILKSEINSDLGGVFYGNLGRCLQFKNRADAALKCYGFSLQILRSKDKDESDLNIGYAYSWISEILLEKNKIQDGLIFLKGAIISWENSAPTRIKKLKDLWKNVICDVETKSTIDKMAEWQIEQTCNSYTF